MFFKLDERLGVTVTAKVYSNLAGQQVNGMSNLTGENLCLVLNTIHAN